jgi:hypothetical protein
MSGIKRRDFIALLSGAAVWPLAGWAQAALPVIGILSGATFESMNALLAWFYPGLESEGFIENRNFTTQFRWVARPDGNLTGVTILIVELLAKNLSLMHELVPSASSIGVLINPANPSQAEAELRDAQTAARALGVGLLALNARTPGEIETAFETLVRQGLVDSSSPAKLFFSFSVPKSLNSRLHSPPT